MLGLQLKNQRLFSLLLPVMTLGMNGLALTIYWVGAALVEAISVADMAARLTMFTNVIVFSTYATYVVMSFMMLVMIFMLYPQAQVSAERINEVLETVPHITEGTQDAAPEQGTLRIPRCLLPLSETRRRTSWSTSASRLARGQTLCQSSAPDRLRQDDARRPDPALLRCNGRRSPNRRREREGLYVRRAL